MIHLALGNKSSEKAKELNVIDIKKVPVQISGENMEKFNKLCAKKRAIS